MNGIIDEHSMFEMLDAAQWNRGGGQSREDTGASEETPRVQVERPAVPASKHFGSRPLSKVHYLSTVREGCGTRPRTPNEVSSGQPGEVVKKHRMS
jgi:hypothetical protein